MNYIGLKALMAQLFLVVMLVACKAQSMEKEMITTGYINPEELKKEKKYSWFNSGYNSYKPDEEIIQQLGKGEKNFSILIFAGEWCSDTHYLLPKYYKTVDLAGITNHQLYFLDRNKKSPDKLEENYNITLIPTFIIIKKGRETGRIEERVNENIEKDLLKLISK